MHLSERNKNSYSHVHSPKLETQMSFNKWMLKLWYIPMLEHHSAIGRSEFIHTTQMDLKRSYDEWKKIQSQNATCVCYIWVFIYRTFLKWQNYRDEKMQLPERLRVVEEVTSCKEIAWGSTVMGLFCIITVTVTRTTCENIT